MPYKDKENQRLAVYRYYIKNKEKMYEYSRKTKRERKFKYFSDKKCLECGCTENLLLHHRKPEEKESHKFWGWSEKRRLVEIEKCDVLCRSCHIKVHVEMGTQRGENNGNAKLKTEDVLEIRRRISLGHKNADIAKDFPVGKVAICQIRTGKRWSNVKEGSSVI